MNYMAAVREELLEKLLSGRKIEGAHGGFMTIDGLLDCAFNDNPREMTEEVAGLLVSIIAYAKDEHTHGERRAHVEKFLSRLAEKYLDEHPDLVREVAGEWIAADREDQYA